MKDYYTEQLVKRKQTNEVMFQKAALIIASIIAVVLAIILPWGIVLVLVMGVVDYFLFMRMDVEYEYLYVNGELDIDAIYMKKSRKKKASYNLKEQLEVLAPIGSAQLTQANSVKSYDFSSREDGAKVYGMILRINQEVISVVFEPNQDILEGIRAIAPRKVNI